MVKWSIDKSWNSAKILHIFSSSEILVLFTQIGSADFTTLADVRPAGSPLGADYVLFKSEPNESAFLKTILKTNSDKANNENEVGKVKKQVSFSLHFLVKTLEKMCFNVGERGQWTEKKQGLKSLNPRPNSLFCTNSWCPTSMQNLESVAQKMAEL